MLPFDIFTKQGRLVVKSGTVLAPGILLQLRYIDVYRKPDSQVAEETKGKAPEAVKVQPKKYAPKLPNKIYDVNSDSTIPPEIQIALKSTFHEIVDTIGDGGIPDITLYTSARDKIVSEVLSEINNISHFNQLRILDEYDYSHGLNVSILSVMLGYKVGLNSYQIKTLALGALLHDIGKIKIPKQIIHKPGALTPKEYEIVKLHAPLGYKILRDEMGLPDEIARPALEHQEKFDGTGYPKGLSGDSIGILSQIVSVCDVYDALVSTKLYSNPKPSQDAIKIMLNYGSKWFNPTFLYKFSHMTNFNE